MLREKTLQQILSVLNRTKIEYDAGEALPKAYQKSVRQVASLYDVRYQTIADGCRRRLGLKDIDEFLKLVLEWLNGDSSNLKRLLFTIFDDSQKKQIDDFFNTERKKPSHEDIKTYMKKLENKLFQENVPETETITFRIPKEKASRIRLLAEISGNTVPQWVSQNITIIANEQYLQYTKDVINDLGRKEKENFLMSLKEEEF